METVIPMMMGGDGPGIEQLLGILGLNLPRVLAVNVLVEWLKVELKARDLWTDQSPWKRWFIFAPFAVAILLCWMMEPRRLGIMGAMKCGAIYAMAAVTLKNFKRTAIAGR